MSKNKTIYLEEILTYISNIRKFTGKLSKEKLLKNHEKCCAILLQLIIIGGTVKKLDEEMRSKIDLPWKSIAGFRDIAVHDYGVLDNAKIVGIVFERLYEVEDKINKYLKENK